jgi:hypothetical protein
VRSSGFACTGAIRSRVAARLPSLGELFQTREHVGVFPHQQNQRRGLIVGLTASLFPPLQCPRVDAQAIREGGPRHMKAVARVPNELVIDSRRLNA